MQSQGAKRDASGGGGRNSRGTSTGGWEQAPRSRSLPRAVNDGSWQRGEWPDAVGSAADQALDEQTTKTTRPQRATATRALAMAIREVEATTGAVWGHHRMSMRWHSGAAATGDCDVAQRADVHGGAIGRA